MQSSSDIFLSPGQVFGPSSSLSSGRRKPATPKPIKGRFGILTSGGPAPGLNSVIRSVTRLAVERGYRVIGFIEGFKYLSEGVVETIDLTASVVSVIQYMGGTILRTSRVNPTKDPAKMENCMRVLKDLGINFLITIGGDGTAFIANGIAEYSKGAIKVVHVPKTIDNDIPLPLHVNTFGFSTAADLGASIVRNLIMDSKSCIGRYFICTLMGRQAGHLALAIGKAAGAHLTVIPEEFLSEFVVGEDGDASGSSPAAAGEKHSAPSGALLDFTKKIPFYRVADLIEGCIIRRLGSGKDHGVICIAEGVFNYMDEEELGTLCGGSVERDDFNRLRLSDLNVGQCLKIHLEKRLASRELEIRLTEKKLGYELRSAPPNHTDLDLTIDLGHAAVDYLTTGDVSKKESALVYIDTGRMVAVPLRTIVDPDTNLTRLKMVDISTESYRTAESYMDKLRPDDLEDDEELEHLADVAGFESPRDLKEHFGYLFDSDLTPWYQKDELIQELRGDLRNAEDEIEKLREQLRVSEIERRKIQGDREGEGENEEE